MRHGHAPAAGSSPTYGSWMSMMGRCYNPARAKYASYGAKGIVVCDRWHDFKNFLADMGERPEGTTLDRYPNSAGNYGPDNCRWATSRQQACNTKRNVLVTVGGESLTVSQWAERVGVSPFTLYDRVRRGMTPEQIISKTRVPRRPIREVL